MTGTVRDPAAPSVGAVRTVPLEPGETVGDPPDSRWRVVRHVADGGFSSVYEVRPATPETVDRHGGAPRALKCLWGTPAELTAIGSEAAKTAAVDGHAGVLRLVTSFRFERTEAPHHHVGLVLELADEDLPTFGARVAPDERAWAAVFEQVAAGLEHIHARRVVHGDIKPTNVLRLGARFAVADFGVSAPLESTRSAGIGLARTIAFWPPESASPGRAARRRGAPAAGGGLAGQPGRRRLGAGGQRAPDADRPAHHRRHHAGAAVRAGLPRASTRWTAGSAPAGAGCWRTAWCTSRAGGG